jgi:hypothetical protein
VVKPDPRSPRCSTSALDGADHPSHQQQASMIRRYIIWRNNHAYDQRLRRFIDRANVACCGTSVSRQKF